MRPARDPRRLLRKLSGLLLCCIAFAGCEPSDPLQVIRQQLARGDYEGSLEALRELLAERRGDAEVQYFYGFALTQAGHASQAEWTLREAMNDPKWLQPAGRQLARGALITRNFPLAIETTNRILEGAPDDVEVLVMRANAHAHSKLDPEAALADVERILKLDPENLDAMEPKILSLLALERVEEAGLAIEALGEGIAAAQIQSGLPGWHCATAAIFAEESGEPELAQERWANCAERYPGHRNVISNGVAFYDSRREYPRGLAILRRGQQLNPESRELRVVLAERLRQSAAIPEAEALLRQATGSDHPQLAAAAWIDLAKHFQEVEDYAESARAAEKGYHRAQEGTGPVHPELLFEYADMLLIAGELDRASAIADEMTVPAHQGMIRARVAQEAGRPQEALERFERAFKLWPDNAFARYYAAIAAEAIGDFDRAIDSYRYVIRISPSATDARQRVARLHLHEGRFEQALHLLRLYSTREALDLEGELLSLRLFARLGWDQQLGRQIAAFSKARPNQLGSAVAHAARGLRERGDLAGAIGLIRGAKARGLDLADPRHGDALRELVRFSQEAGRPAEAKPDVEAALLAHPDAAIAHEIHGLQLELAGGAGAEEAYARALELDPENAGALQGLGRLAGDDPKQALAYLDRAFEQVPEDPEVLRQAAAVLIAAGRPQQAEDRLESLLGEHPYDSSAAAQLAELQLGRDVSTERTLELARRAVRFGGGAEALELLGRVHQRRGESEQASRAAERARTLREGHEG